VNVRRRPLVNNPLIIFECANTNYKFDHSLYCFNNYIDKDDRCTDEHKHECEYIRDLNPLHINGDKQYIVSSVNVILGYQRIRLRKIKLMS